MTDKKKKELTDLQKKFLDCLMDDEHRGNIRKAMKTAGYADTVPSSSVLKSLHEEITELAKQTIAAHSGVAVFATLDILDNPAALGAANKLNAAKSILDRAGVHKKEDTDVNLKVPTNGLVILPAKEYDRDEKEVEKEE